jgi:hypothetical protein
MMLPLASLPLLSMNRLSVLRYRALRASGVAIVLALASACATSPPPSSATAAGDVPYEIVRRKDSYPFAEKLTSVRLVNRYGDLRVRMTDDNAVGVSAVIQRIGAKPRDPAFDVHRQDGRFELVVRYRGDDPDAAVDFRRGRVDLVVFVSRNAALDLTTGDGTLEARRSNGAVRARTEAGALTVTASGRLDLRSRSGRILARQLEPGWSGGDSRIESIAGSIRIGVPTRGDYRLEAGAGAGVTVAPGWKPDELTAPSGTPRHFTLHRGAGVPLIDVRTGGSIEISPVILLDTPRRDPPRSRS